ncbi:hypothetical protein W97_07890 [Coniosporium apollinis CBS 100218]|uniref:Uncharacterized protein n=1 Tax=Coniosporium apollinis (strain CBS 100218) TaxID=1168221 RepID=R7Z3B3_CONA1|nr:uncharacterized protein W97_07890 [Coniosporium apollinis CBS 100218]EON68632.1 hypothetical protein W97_07890 [Coniosporium apollinis CBS 100218]
MSIWFLAYLFTRARRNSKVGKRVDDFYVGKGIRQRILLVFRFARGGHLRLMFKSGAFLGLLTGGRYGYYMDWKSNIPPFNEFELHVSECRGRAKDLKCELDSDAMWPGWSAFRVELSYMFGFRSLSAESKALETFYKSHPYARKAREKREE